LFSIILNNKPGRALGEVEVSLVEPMPVLLIGLIVVIGLLIMAGLFSKPLMTFMRHYLPYDPTEGDTFLLWSGLVVTAFILGLLVMYIMLRS